MNNEKNPAYNYALRLLAKRDYSRAKLGEKLRGRDFESEEVESALDELIQRQYLREDYYAEARVKGFMHKGLSPSMIQNRLAEEDCIVELSFIEKIYAEYRLVPSDQIKQLLEKKLRAKKFADMPQLDYGAKQKVVASVVRKGHSPRDVFQALDEVLRER